MAVSDLLMQGVNLMLLGMGIVFIFLMILVLAMNGMSRLAAILSGPDTHETQPETSGTGTEDEELIAVISAAISRFRAKK